MEHFVGLDVSVKETSVCIVDDTGRIVREEKVASEPEALLAVLTNYRFKRIGLEAGPLSQWLFSALAEAGLPAICVETRHMQAVLKAQINKTDRNDARGIAQMMRVGLYRPVHVKTLRSQKLRMLLTHRKLLQSKAIAIENDLRATLRNFGLKVPELAISWSPRFAAISQFPAGLRFSIRCFIPRTKPDASPTRRPDVRPSVKTAWLTVGTMEQHLQSDRFDPACMRRGLGDRQ